MIYIFAALASLFALLAWRIARQIWYTYQCPGEEALRQFWFARMDKESEEYRNLIAHLGHCENCREELHRIQRGKPLEDHLLEE